MNTLAILGAVIGLVSATLFWSKVPQVEHFQTELRSDLLEGKTKKLSEYTNFEWDRVVVVNDYGSITAAWDTIGYVWLGYLLTPSFGVDESWYHWIFMKEGTVVAHAQVRHVSGMDWAELPPSLPSAPPFDGREFAANDVLEVQTWEDESYPLCRRQLVAVGRVPQYVGIRRFETDCPPDVHARQAHHSAILKMGLTLERRWHDFSKHLPEDVQQKLGKAYYGYGFFLLAEAESLQESTWCDAIAFDTLVEASPERMVQKCLSIAEQFPHQARVLPSNG